MSNKKVDGTLCFFRHTQGNNTGELVSVAVDIEKEEDRKQFIPLFQRLLKYPEFVRAMEETKGSHSTTSEDSLLRDLKKEIIKLKSLNRRAAEEIRDLDDMIIKSIEDNKVIEYPEEDKAYFAGFSSINLLNRLEGRTNGGYVENYDDLHLEMKTLDGGYQVRDEMIDEVFDQITSCANKAAKQVMEEHSETLQKLADNPVCHEEKENKGFFTSNNDK